MTNQNDTQDEAERMAINKIAGDVNLLTKIHCLEIPEVALALKKAYRAGKEPQLNLNRMLLSTNGSLKETVAALQEELNQSKRETQAAVHRCEQSRSEVERLNEKWRLLYNEGYEKEKVLNNALVSARTMKSIFEEQLAASLAEVERLKQELKDALK